ncbi:hypothetical protein GIB67_026101 [Kingdonia uniflora]|uniref:Glycosyltransferase n=1 Tax=Kingdonia uniflora TaxID=39325 RepID=A0A7J7M2X6_9MAGN|nr:hypothetical protein GIB67_026101 [Kingdonia uniflora]
MATSSTTFHAAMFPWFAIGHLTPFLHLANKFAERGHRVSFLLPTKTQTKLNTFNLHPDLISFIPLVVPHVDGLPLGAETMSDTNQGHALCVAMDNMKSPVEVVLEQLKPDIIFYDFANWIPAFARRLGIKSVFYNVVSAAAVAYLFVPARKLSDVQKGNELKELMQPPSGFPDQSLEVRLYEASTALFAYMEFGNSKSIYERITTAMNDCDAIGIRTCLEIESPSLSYMESQYGKPLLCSGPLLPEPPTLQLEDRWTNWLGHFKEKSVIYCALGSEVVLKKDQFLELVLGLELTGLPFFAALKSPSGASTIEEALPEGFHERVGERGVVHGGWVQQQLILGHPSVGCFVSHCGFGSMWESLLNDAQIVLLPQLLDQCLNTKSMTNDLKVAVEIERREEDGWFTRENVCNAVKLMMDEESEIGINERANHIKIKKLLSKKGFETSYIDSFIANLQGLL